MTQPLGYHPLANLFPLIEGADFDRFVEGFRADGTLHDKIVLLDGQILDGRNRYRACQATGITPHFEQYNFRVHGDALKYVVSKNLHRRHLTDDQRRMLAAKLVTMQRGRPSEDGQENFAEREIKREEAAEIAKVDVAGVDRARSVVTHGAEELQKAVEDGRVTVNAAAEIVKALPVEEQRKLLAEVAEAPDTKKAFNGVVKDLRRVRQDEKKQKRKDKIDDLGGKMRSLPAEKFGVILADPEWPFEVWSEDTGQDRAAANHYPTSTIEVIKSRPVASIAAKECVLGLWATVPKLPAALDVMREWGFTYVTHIAWVKDRIGTGYWLRNNHEILLIGKKGAPPKPADGTQWRSSITAPRGAHSEKPDFQYEFFETFFPGWPAIELNARRARLGWKAWGLEAPEDHVPDAGNMPPHDPETGELTDPPSSEAGSATSAPAIEPSNPGGGHEEVDATPDSSDVNGSGAGEGSDLPDDPASDSAVIPLPEERRAFEDDGPPVEPIPDWLRRGNPACPVKGEGK